MVDKDFRLRKPSPKDLNLKIAKLAQVAQVHDLYCALKSLSGPSPEPDFDELIAPEVPD